MYCLPTDMLALCIHIFTYATLRVLSLHMLHKCTTSFPNSVLRFTKGITLLCRWIFERRRSKKVAAASGSESAARMAVGREQLQCRMLVTLLTTMSFYFPTVFATTLAFFTCYRLDSAVSGAAYADNAKVSDHRIGSRLSTHCNMPHKGSQLEKPYIWDGGGGVGEATYWTYQ